MTPLKIIDIAFLPADSISSCNLLLAVKNKAACKCLFDKSFLNTVDFRTLVIEEVMPHKYQMPDNYFLVLFFLTFKVQWF